MKYLLRVAREDVFDKFAKLIAHAAGRPHVFVAAFALILVWLVSGPIFGFSDTWQLIINTSTTIITFLMVFLIQNTQNRDTTAVQLKLDELIRALEGAHDRLIDLEEKSTDELEAMHKKYLKLASQAKNALEDTGRPEIDFDEEPGTASEKPSSARSKTGKSNSKRQRKAS